MSSDKVVLRPSDKKSTADYQVRLYKRDPDEGEQSSAAFRLHSDLENVSEVRRALVDKLSYDEFLADMVMESVEYKSKLEKVEELVCERLGTVKRLIEESRSEDALRDALYESYEAMKDVYDEVKDDE